MSDTKKTHTKNAINDLQGIVCTLPIIKGEDDGEKPQTITTYTSRGKRLVSVSSFRERPVYFVKMYPKLGSSTNATEAQLALIAQQPLPKLSKIKPNVKEK